MKTTNICPIAEVPVGPVCPVTRCAHNQQGACSYVEAFSIEGDLNKTSALYGVSPDDVQEHANSIQLALVASRWFEHINGKSVLNARESDFKAAKDPTQAAEFSQWNTSAFNFGQVLMSLDLLNQRL